MRAGGAVNELPLVRKVVHPRAVKRVVAAKDVGGLLLERYVEGLRPDGHGRRTHADGGRGGSGGLSM